MLTTASLLSILFMTFHLTGDILFKMAPAGLANLFAVFVFVVQLYGTLVLGGRRAGYIIILFGSLLGPVIAVVHMKGTRRVIGGDIGNSSQAFLFVWNIVKQYAADLGLRAVAPHDLRRSCVKLCHAIGGHRSDRKEP